ncbi:Putative disease resistance RPP13-like protein 1 [Linum perenne]
MEVLASVSGALLSESVKMLIQKLDAHELLMYYRQAGEVMAELKMWEGMLRKIYAALDDAEEKQMTSRLVSIWLSELRGLAYDAEDVLDSFSTEQLRRKLKEEAASSSAKRLPTTSLVNESRVYGRENDEHAILQLLKAEAADVSISVIPIIGMGGLGKTTLAQLVLSRAKSGFDFTAWVSVGEDFDVHRITKTILDSAGSEGKDLNSLQEQLKEKLSRKKFLIVLDDVWNENYEKWVLCRAPLESGSSGSKIVITTRNASVASIMGTDPPYHLKELAFNGCLSLFAEHGLGAKTFAAHSNLEEIGNKIVEKCRGLPLAVKVMGGLLRGKQDPRLWEEVLNSKIWEFPESNGILPALRVSYYHLPSHLKQCFAYCGILPKDFEIEEDELVLLWMAEGFLAQAKEKKYAKDLGHRYFRDLVSRSFFQQSSEDKSRFTMHDLINDLAEFESRSICFKLDGNLEETNSCSKVRYSSFNRHTYDLLPRLYKRYFLSNKMLFELIPKLRYLRVLSLAGYKLEKLPEMIFALEHLRYLNLSYTDIVSLSELVGELVNLQTLRLQGCRRLVKLPRSIGNLINLQLLDNQKTYNLQELPAEIAKLINLTDLSIQDSPELEWFPDIALPLLRIIKRLRIRCCKNLRSLPNQLPELTSLLLLWVNSCGSLKSFPKGGFPSNLIVLRIEHCKSLGQPISEWGINRLTSLKRLTISGECPSTKLPTYFPDNEGSWLPTSLTFLLISEFSELKSISRGLGCLTSIEELMLMNCPKVRRLPKKGLPASLGSLKLNACPGLKKRCLEQKGEYWPLMQQIPCVEIDSIESSSYSCQEP